MRRCSSSKIVCAAALLAAAVCAAPRGGAACERCTDFDFLCCDIPADNRFYLTSFSGEGMACGGYADGAWYYSTSWVRWYCDAKLAVTNPDTGECVVVQVADAGPAAWVEERAGMPILDASTQVCRDLFDSSSCGWSDRFEIVVVQVPDGTPLGPGRCPSAEPPAEEAAPEEVVERLPDEPAVEPAADETLERPLELVEPSPGEFPPDGDLLPGDDAFAGGDDPADGAVLPDATVDPAGEEGGLLHDVGALESGCACGVAR